MRSMARPLAPSPLSRPAAAGRPGVSARSHSAAPARLNGARADRRRRPEPVRAYETAPRSRSHAERAARRSVSGRDTLKRRRANVLFVLALTGASAAFLAATTSSPAMIWVAVAAFVALIGYVCLLGQLRQLEPASAPVARRQAPPRVVGETRRHSTSRSAQVYRQPAARRAADRWSHAV